MIDLFQIDAEQAVVDHDVFDHVVVAAHVETGIVGVVRLAGTGEMQAAQHRIAGIERHHRALVAGINGHLPAAIDGQRLVDADRPGVVARRRTQHRTRRGLVHQVLKRFQAVDTLVALDQHEDGFRAVDGHTRGIAHISPETQFMIRIFIPLADGGPAQKGKGQHRPQQACGRHGVTPVPGFRAVACGGSGAPASCRQKSPAGVHSPSKDRSRSRTAPPCLRQTPSA